MVEIESHTMNTSKAGIPKDIQKAMTVDFGTPVTAYLMCAVDCPPVVLGVVYCDSRRRFRDGSSIRTSSIIRIDFIDGYALVKTLGGSLYVIVSWQPPGTSWHMNRIFH